MNRLWLDLETYSEADVKRVGAWRYCNDWSTEVLLIGAATNDDAPRLVSSDELRSLVKWADEVVSHNAAFERNVLTYVLGIHTQVESWLDSAAFAAACGLPRKLSTLCKVLKLPVDQAKDKRGTRLISLLCKPDKHGKRNRDPALMAEFAEYNLQDVVAMRECWRRLPDKTLTPTERRVMQVDMLINERGVQVDTSLAKAAQRQYADYVASADNRLAKATGGAVTSVSQVADLRAYLQMSNVLLPDLRATTVEDALAGDLPDEVRHILELRQIGSKTGGAKFDRFVELSDVDGRAHDLHMYAGAHTGRWSGRLLQIQNMPRAAIKDTDTAAEIVKAGEIDEWYASPMAVLNSVTRACIVAAPGMKLIAGDFSSIEARVVAWLAGQTNTLEVFRTHGKLYEATAAAIYRVPIDEVTEEQRQVGKVGALSCAYGGSVNAFSKMATAYHVTLPDDVDDIVKRWRAANKKIVSFWYDLDRAVREVLSDDWNGDVLTVCKIRVSRRKKTLLLTLPSGRHLRYHNAHVNDMDEIEFLGMDAKTFNFTVQRTYGARLVENVTQAVARDVLAEALLRLNDAGYSPVAHIHDEVISEVPLDYTADEFNELLITNPSWCRDLPLNAKSHEMLRYRKM